MSLAESVPFGRPLLHPAQNNKPQVMDSKPVVAENGPHGRTWVDPPQLLARSVMVAPHQDTSRTSIDDPQRFHTETVRASRVEETDSQNARVSDYNKLHAEKRMTNDRGGPGGPARDGRALSADTSLARTWRPSKKEVYGASSSSKPSVSARAWPKAAPTQRKTGHAHCEIKDRSPDLFREDRPLGSSSRRMCNTCLSAAQAATYASPRPFS